MSISIRSNWSGSTYARSLNSATWGFMRSMERLASGLRINRASDDPAGLVISEQLRSQIGSLNQEIENTTNLIHKYQAGSSTVSELRGQLTEMRSLAVAAANEGFNDEAAQAAYAATADYLVGTYNHTIDTATYNGMNLLDGSEGSLAEVTALEGVDLSSAESAEASIAVIDEAVAELDSIQVDLGATQANELESQRSSMEVTVQNLTAAESQLRDLDYAQEYSNMVGNMIRMQASAALFAHHKLGANTVLQLFGAD